MKPILTIQIGKNGTGPGFFSYLESIFKNTNNIKIHVLKSAGHSKERTKEIAEEIMKKLGKNYTYRIIGFTISIKKWRKAKDQA